MLVANTDAAVLLWVADVRVLMIGHQRQSRLLLSAFDLYLTKVAGVLLIRLRQQERGLRCQFTEIRGTPTCVLAHPCRAHSSQHRSRAAARGWFVPLETQLLRFICSS